MLAPPFRGLSGFVVVPRRTHIEGAAVAPPSRGLSGSSSFRGGHVAGFGRAHRRKGLGTKPECALESMVSRFALLSRIGS